MNTFSFARLSLILKELWGANKWLIFSIPLVMILLFWLYNMLPNSIYHKWGNTYGELKDWRFLTIIHSGTFLRTTILGVIPVYLYMCFSGYLRELKTNSLCVLTPVSVLERVLGIWVFSIGLSLVLVAFFYLTDYLFVYIHRALFLDETLKTLEENGDLYYDFGATSVFSVLDQSNFPIGLFLGIGLSTMPVLFLAGYKIPRTAILFYPLLGIVAIILLFPFVPYVVRGSYYLNISASPLFILLYSGFVTGHQFLWMAAFYYMIKENEA